MLDNLQSFLENLLINYYSNFFISTDGLFSLKKLFILIFACFLIYRFVKSFKTLPSLRKTPTDFFLSVLKVFIGAIKDPLDITISLNAFLLFKILNSMESGVGIKKALQDQGLSLVGWVVTSFVIYVVGLFLVYLNIGIPLKDIHSFIQIGSLQKLELVFHIWPNIFYLKPQFISLYGLCVFFKAQRDFYFPKFDLAKKLGLKHVIPIGKWDASPRLDIPDDEIIKNSQNSIMAFLAKANGGRVDIKIASGFDCFGPKGFLKDFIQTNTHIHWRILLLDPSADSAAKRFQAYKGNRSADALTGVSQKQYLQGITDRIAELKKLKQQNPNIEIRVYEHTPQWRMYLTSKEIIVSGFGPGQRSDRSPLFHFEESSTSIFHGFREMFDDIWHNSSRSV